jgi:hypothetical protein
MFCGIHIIEILIKKYKQFYILFLKFVFAKFIYICIMFAKLEFNKFINFK